MAVTDPAVHDPRRSASHTLLAALPALAYLLFPYVAALRPSKPASARSRIRYELTFVGALLLATVILTSLGPRMGWPLALGVYYAGAAVVFLARVLFSTGTPGSTSSFRGGRFRAPESLQRQGKRLVIAAAAVAVLIAIFWPVVSAIINGVRTASPARVSGVGNQEVAFSVTKDGPYRAEVVVTATTQGCAYATVSIRADSGGVEGGGGASASLPAGATTTVLVAEASTFISGDYHVQVDATPACSWTFRLTPIHS